MQEHATYYGLSEKWVSAKNLKPGDKVLLSDGTFGVVQSVSIENLSIPEATYNLEVEAFHTYYVTESNVLVHNTCQDSNQRALTEIIKQRGKRKPLEMRDAKTLVECGREYGIDVQIHSGHALRSGVSQRPHLHTGFNNWHIPINR